MKKFLLLVGLMFISTSVFVSCSSDNDDEADASAEYTSKIIGTWKWSQWKDNGNDNPYDDNWVDFITPYDNIYITFGSDGSLSSDYIMKHYKTYRLDAYHGLWLDGDTYWGDFQFENDKTLILKDGYKYYKLKK